VHKWEGIEAFVQVASQQSFSRAAKILGVSNSHVSKQVANLERHLDAQLLTRTTRKVSLTEMGHAFFIRCQDIVNTLDEAEQAVIDLQEKPRGRLRVSLAGAFGEEFIAPAAVSFMRDNPGLHIELSFDNKLVDLVADGYDIAIRAGMLEDSSLIARRVCNRKLLTCASQYYIDRYGRPETVDSLINHHCLIGTLDTWRFREGQRHFDMRVRGNWRSNNGRALAHAAVGGLGIAQLPDFYVREALERGALVTLLEDFNPTDTGVWAVYPHNRHLSAKVRMFISHLVEQLADATPALAP
jgi:DNA-binding transcriptional LysR family regulator